VSSPIKVVNIAKTAKKVSSKIAMIRIIAILVLIFLGFLAVAVGVSYVQAYLAPLEGSMGNNCPVDTSSKINAQTGTGDFTSPDQQKNAQLIIDAVAARNLPKRAAVIALATAMQESKLINVNFGDDLQGVTNPDGTLTTSRGLFQQQSPWGPLSVRLDPTGATNLFLDRLVRIPNWQTLPLTVAAQDVQGSAYPMAYAQYEIIATEIVNQKNPTTGSYGTSSGLAPALADASGSKELADCKAGGTIGMGTTSGKGDDYPQEMKDAPTDSADPWGYLTRECVSFVAWRMNVQMGWKPGEPWKFSAATVGLLGNANAWEPILASKGYKYDNTPAPGAIAWWGGVGVLANGVHTGELGHVAVVSKVNAADGTVDIEQYNAIPPHEYSTMTIPKEAPYGYIHVADIP
jgi:surface antigen